MIDSTRAKIPIFKGNNESEVYQGQGSLTKLQFKEVSSFYSNKGIFFVMYAKPQSFKYNNNSSNYNDRNINYNYIRPLVIRDIIVKAKKKWYTHIWIIVNIILLRFAENIWDSILINNSYYYLSKFMLNYFIIDINVT